MWLLSHNDDFLSHNITFLSYNYGFVNLIIVTFYLISSVSSTGCIWTKLRIHKHLLAIHNPQHSEPPMLTANKWLTGFMSFFIQPTMRQWQLCTLLLFVHLLQNLYTSYNHNLSFLFMLTNEYWLETSHHCEKQSKNCQA